MKTLEINDLPKLQNYRDAWQELLAQTPYANFFQTFDWLEIYWKHFGNSQLLRVLVVLEGGVVKGFLPWVIRRERTKVGPLSFATYPLDHWGSFYGPIAADPSSILAVGLDYLKSDKSDWDVLEPRWIGAHPSESSEVEQLLVSTGNTPVAGEMYSTAVVDLAGSWDSYLAARGSKWRNNANRWERQLSQLGEVTHFRYRPVAGTDAKASLEHYEECLRIADASWQGTSTNGTTLTHDSVAAFLRDVHLSAARSGCLDLNLLRIDGRAVAFTYNYVYQGNVFSLRSGYDPDCKGKGMGSLLYVKAIKDSYERGDWRYDLGPGSLEIKRNLLTSTLPVYRFSCFNRWSVRQQLMRLYRSRKSPVISPTTVASLDTGATTPAPV